MSLLLLYDDASDRPRARVLRGTMAVGRDARSTGIVLEDASIASLHATIDADGSSSVVSRVSADAAIFVNELLVKTAPLAHGDIVRFGDVEANVVDAGRWTEVAAVPRRSVLRPGAPQAPAPAKAPEPAAGTRFPFLRVAAVTAVLFVAAFGIYSARNVKWHAPLDPESARLAERRARGLRALIGPSLTADAQVTPVSVSPAPLPRNASFLSGLPPNTPSARAENALGAAVRSVVSITGDVRVDGQRGTILGSGFFVSETGLILTNAHVMDHEGRYRARTHDGRSLDLMDRERDRSLDLGLLAAIGEGPFPALLFGKAKDMTYGDQVWAIGSPLSPELGFSVTRGVVSSPLRIFNGRSFIQHDAAINPGNSGGPLVDAAGRLVGVNTWKVAGEAQGLGFAIPVEVVEGVLKAWKVRP
jgi:S1-C subfamily serine protease